MGQGRLQQKIILVLLLAILGSFAPMAPLRVQPPSLEASTNATPPETATPPQTPPAPPTSSIPPPEFDPETTDPEPNDGPKQAQILLAPWGVQAGTGNIIGGNDKIWHYHDGVWSTIEPPVHGWYWYSLAASKFDSKKWLLLGNSAASNYTKFDVVPYTDPATTVTVGIIKDQSGQFSPLWYTGDAGANWTQVELRHPSVTAYDFTTGQSKACIEKVEWSDDTPGKWAVAGYSTITPISTFFWRGTNGSVLTGDGPYDAANISGRAYTAGLDNDLVIASAGGGGLQYAAASGTNANSFQRPGTVYPNWDSNSLTAMDRLPGVNRGIALMHAKDIWGTSDYRAAQPASLETNQTEVTGSLPQPVLTAAIPDSLAELNTIYVGGRTGSMLRITDLYGARVKQTIAVNAYVDSVRADRQTRTIVGALLRTDAGTGAHDANDPITGVFLRQGSAEWKTISIPVSQVRALEILYGPVVATVGSSPYPQVVTIPSGGTGHEDQLWYYHGGIWEALTPPVSGAYWQWIAADNTDPNRWLLLGNTANTAEYTIATNQVKMSDGTTSPLWYSPDAGKSWQAVIIPPQATSATKTTIKQVEWQNGRIVLVGYGDGDSALWTGTPTNLVREATSHYGGSTSRLNWANLEYVIGGLNGEVVVTENDSPGSLTSGRMAYVPYQDTSFTAAETIDTMYGGPLQIDRILGSRTIIGVSPNTFGQNTGRTDIRRTTNYRTTSPTNLLAGTETLEMGQWVGVTGHASTVASAYIGGRVTAPYGVLKIPDALASSPTSSVIIGENNKTGFLRTDRQRKQTVAVIGYRGTSASLDGIYLLPSSTSSWNLLSMPNIKRADRLEVLREPPLPDDQNRFPCECQAQPEVGDGVNSRTGNHFEAATDLADSRPGPALSWSRVYHSQAIGETSGTIGGAWQSIYEARIIAEALPEGGSSNNGRVIISPEGNRLRFRKLPDGSFEPYPGVFGTLTAVGNTYTWTQPNQQQMVFDFGNGGRLTSIVDPQGGELSLKYLGPNGALSQIVDTANTDRKINVVYNTAGTRIASVNDGNGRSVSYTYNNTYTPSRLTAVTDVMQKTSTYEYNSPLNPYLLTAVKNPLGEAVEQTTYLQAGTEFKVSSQTLQDQRTVGFNYGSNATTVTTTGQDSTSNVDVINFGFGELMTSRAVNGEPVSGTEWSGNFQPSKIVDGNGNATRLTFTKAGMPSKITNALGESVTATYYTSNNQPQTITDAEGRKTELTYNAKNLVTKIVSGITTNNPLGFTTNYIYTGGYLTEMQSPDGTVTQYQNYTSGAWLGLPNKVTTNPGTSDELITTLRYDNFGRVVTTTLALNTALERKTVVHYNADNSIYERIENYKDGVTNLKRPDEDIITRYVYDELGRLLKTITAYGTPLARTDFTRYNTKGQVEEVILNYQDGQFDLDAPDQDVATRYHYDGLGRVDLTTETGILTGTFNTAARRFNQAMERVTRTEYNARNKPRIVTQHYSTIDTRALPDLNITRELRYDAAGNIKWERDELGRWTRYKYDAMNRVTKVIRNYENGDPETVDPTNASWATKNDTDLISVTVYGQSNQVNKAIDNYVDGVFETTKPITDRVTLYEYDELGRQLRTTVNYTNQSTTLTELNQVTETIYDAKSRVSGVKDNLGRWNVYHYDSAGRQDMWLENCVDAAGTKISVWNTCFGLASPQTVPDRNLPHKNTYDLLSRVTATSDFANESRSYYDGVGRVVKQIQNYVDGNPQTGGVDEDTVTLRQYDLLGRTVVVTDVLGAVTRYQYDALGHTTVMTDSVGRVTRYGYDGSGAQRWSMSPDGRFSVNLIDGLGRVVKQVKNYQNTTGPDPADVNLTTQTVYDRGGRVLQAIDAAGWVTSYRYDLRDQLIEVIENDQPSCTGGATDCDVVTRYGYDRVGNSISMTDANGHTRKAEYDAAGRQRKSIDALLRVTEWNYDKGNRRTEQIDPRLDGGGNNLKLTYSYDGVDRTSAVAVPGLAQPIEYRYDWRGNRKQLIDTTGTTTFSLDKRGRVTSVQAPNSGTVGYGYNQRGDRTSITYPDTTQLIYDYFSSGQLKTVTQGMTTLASYSYDAAGRLSTVARANNTTTSYGYDQAGRLTDMANSWTAQSTLISAYQYELDRSGWRRTLTETDTESADIRQEWEARYTAPSTGSETANDIVVDAQGNSYVTGYAMQSGSGQDVVTIKYNSQGVQQWAVTYNGPGNGTDYGTKIALDSLGNVVVAGSSQGSGTGYDIVVLRYNTQTGTQVNTPVRYNGPGNGNDYASDMTDSAGLVAGTSRGTANDDMVVLTMGDQSYGVLAAFRYNGPANGNDGVSAVALAPNSDIYLAGYSTGATSQTDLTLVKLGQYNPNAPGTSGAVLWTKTYNGTANGADRAVDVVSDSSGVYVTGTTSGSGTGSDITTITYSHSGAQSWLATYPATGSVNEDAVALAVDAQQNVYVTGSYALGMYAGDMVTVKYNSSGVQQWAAICTGTNGGVDRPADIAVDGGGNVYIAGAINGSPVGTADSAVLKYNADGVQRWLKTYNGPATGGDSHRAMVIDARGTIYVTGYATVSTPTSRDTITTLKYSPSIVTSYHYDGLGRMTAALESPGSSYVYAYDKGGNRTFAQKDADPAQIWSYDNADQISNSGWTYDSAGNLLSDGSGTSYSYDLLNRLTSATKGGVTTLNTYNGDGVLVHQEVQGGPITDYTHDLITSLTQVLVQKQGTTTTNFLYGLGRLASSIANVRTWELQDAMGSVRRTTNEAGILQSQALRYDPWGNPISTAQPSPFGFTGELYDGNSDLSYLRARWYSPELGSFLGRDPQGGNLNNPYTFHYYQYAYSSPATYADPSGERPASDDEVYGCPGDKQPDGKGNCIPRPPSSSIPPAPSSEGSLSGGGQFARRVNPNAQPSFTWETFVQENARRYPILWKRNIARWEVETNDPVFAQKLAYAYGIYSANPLRYGTDSFNNIFGEAVLFNIVFLELGDQALPKPSFKEVGAALEKLEREMDEIKDAGGEPTDKQKDAECRLLSWLSDHGVDADYYMGGVNTAARLYDVYAKPYGYGKGSTQPAQYQPEVQQPKPNNGTCGLNSFSAETLIATEEGEVPIAEIEVGDRVLAYNEETGETGYYTVTNVLVHLDPAIVQLNIGGEEVLTTPEHPFYITGEGWVEAGELTFGSSVRTSSGTTGLVRGAKVVRQPRVMYNLTVAVAHTFFVGDGHWLVHNQAGRCLTVDEAIELAVQHVGEGGIMEQTKGGNYQFRRVFINANGDLEARMARIDINPSDPHVGNLGPHLNLEVQINGKKVGTDPHYPIDVSTARPGDTP